MESFALQAGGDESMRTVRLGQPSYLLGAIVADPLNCEAFLEELERIPRRGPKLHWRDQDDRSRRASIATIAKFEAYHVVVVAAPVDPRAANMHSRTGSASSMPCRVRNRCSGSPTKCWVRWGKL